MYMKTQVCLFESGCVSMKDYLCKFSEVFILGKINNIRKYRKSLFYCMLDIQFFYNINSSKHVLKHIESSNDKPLNCTVIQRNIFF